MLPCLCRSSGRAPRQYQHDPKRGSTGKCKGRTVNGILKDELLAERYDKYDQAKAAVERAVHLYNNERPHLSIDMLTPEQAHGKTGELKKLWKNTYATKKAKEAVMDG